MDGDIALTPPSSDSRENTTPFLIRTFVKLGGFHRLNLFEDGSPPTTDEQQIYTWKDATLREVLTTLRNAAPLTPEYRHPLARYSFRTAYADSTNKGRFASKDLGIVYSRDILGEPGTISTTAPRLLEDEEVAPAEPADQEKEERTLESLRFMPGDYLLVAVILPKNVTVTGPSGEIAIKGSAAAAPTSVGWKSAPAGGSRVGDNGWGHSLGAATSGRGGGHWRGDSNPPLSGPGGRGRGGRGIDRDADRRAPPPRRDSPPPRFGGRGGRRSRSRSQSPPRRRRYD